MVHALSEAHRVLRPGGLVVDLRPGYGSSDLDGSRSREWVRLGPAASWIDDEGKKAANQAVARALAAGWLRLRSREVFPLYYYFPDVTELETYATERWSDAVLDQDTLGRARSMGAAPLRLERPMNLQVLERVG